MTALLVHAGVSAVVASLLKCFNKHAIVVEELSYGSVATAVVASPLAIIFHHNLPASLTGEVATICFVLGCASVHLPMASVFALFQCATFGFASASLAAVTVRQGSASTTHWLGQTIALAATALAWRQKK